MKKALLALALLFLSHQLLFAEEEAPKFSLMVNLGSCYSTGFIPSSSPDLEGGIRAGLMLSKRVETLWGVDYHSMPNQQVTLQLPSPSNPVSFQVVQPTDDFAFSVDIRWYLSDNHNDATGTFNTTPYLVGGLGFDFLVD